MCGFGLGSNVKMRLIVRISMDIFNFFRTLLFIIYAYVSKFEQ